MTTNAGDPRFAFECPFRWEVLDASNDPGVRNCAQCAPPCTSSRNAAEDAANARAGHCVALEDTAPAWRQRGHSMTGKIAGGDLCTVVASA